MRFHDWHLLGYSVFEGGRRIVLHLHSPPSSDSAENDIEFTDVAAYHFVHGEGAIITDIDEAPIRAYIDEQRDFILATAHQHGLRYFDRDVSTYQDALGRSGHRYWRIDSAIGFGGFVVARSVAESLPSAPPREPA